MQYNARAYHVLKEDMGAPYPEALNTNPLRQAPMNTKSETAVSGASSSRKLLNALLCFSEKKPFWTVPELATELKLSSTSTYRYVALLREVGLLEGAPGNAYRVTDLVQGLAAACEAARPPLAEVALPYLTNIRNEVDETVLIARRSGHSVYCVDRVESNRPVRLQFERGQAMTLHRGSMARILLAGMSKKERASYLQTVQSSLEPSLVAQLSDGVLDSTRERGWTESYEEVDEGIWGAAAAITSQGQIIASIGMAAPIFRLDKPKRDYIITLLREAAAEISIALDQG